jgi:hypothetical protein
VSQVTQTNHELAKEVTKTPEKGEKFHFFTPVMNFMSFNTGMSAGGKKALLSLPGP